MLASRRTLVGETDQRAQLEQARALAPRDACRLTEAGRCRRICRPSRRIRPQRQFAAQPMQFRLEPAFAGLAHERQRFPQGLARGRRPAVLHADLRVEGEHVVHAFEHGDVAPLLQHRAHPLEAAGVAARGGRPAGEGAAGPAPVVDAAFLAGAEDLERPSFEQGASPHSCATTQCTTAFRRPRRALDGAGDRHSGRKMPFGGGGVCPHDAGDGA
jgi:hypothetical protein